MYASRWLKLAETGKLFRHILMESLRDPIRQNLVIRLEKQLLCSTVKKDQLIRLRECSSHIFSVVSGILKHHRCFRVEEEGR